MRLTLVTALSLGVVLLALTPVINVTLQLHNTLMAALLGLSAIPLTIAAGCGHPPGRASAGARSSAVYIASASPDSLGVALLVLEPRAAWAALGSRSRLLAPVVVGLTRCGTALARPTAAAGSGPVSALPRDARTTPRHCSRSSRCQQRRRDRGPAVAGRRTTPASTPPG